MANCQIFGLFVEASEEEQSFVGYVYVLPNFQIFFTDSRHGRNFNATIRRTANDPASYEIVLPEVGITYLLEYVDPKGGECYWVLHKDKLRLGLLLNTKIIDWMTSAKM